MFERFGVSTKLSFCLSYSRHCGWVSTEYQFFLWFKKPYQYYVVVQRYFPNKFFSRNIFFHFQFRYSILSPENMGIPILIICSFSSYQVCYWNSRFINLSSCFLNFLNRTFLLELGKITKSRNFTYCYLYVLISIQRSIR